MQLSLFENTIKQPIELYDLFEAYFACRRNKRKTINALAFEVDFEKNLIQLWEGINNGTYEIARSIAFIIKKPVKREIFAADFRDRIVHHLLIGKLNPLFEKQFIYDSYACRVGKGTHFGIQRVDRFIRRCSQNYTKDCYVLKLDIHGFFMHIHKKILYSRLEQFIRKNYNRPDKQIILELCQKVVFNDPAENCILKGSQSDWEGLPKSKSLFHSPPDCGLPIGNLTSQVFANFYMDPFDHFIKHDLGIKYYGRYVDDFILVHSDKNYLKAILPRIAGFLNNNLNLNLHPKKIYLQHYSKGVKFLGVVIKPNRIYVGKRIKANFYDAIKRQSQLAMDHKPGSEELTRFLSSMNSYLGIMKHYQSYRIRKKMLFKNLSVWWWNLVYLSGGVAKFVRKKRRSKKPPKYTDQKYSYLTMQQLNSSIYSKKFCLATPISNIE